MSSASRKFISPPPTHFNEQPLARQHFDFFSKLMYEFSGVNLPFSTKNEALVKNRLSKLLRKDNFEDYDALAKAMKNAAPQLISDFISTLTTNKTHFYREEAHFLWLAPYLKSHFKDANELRVWCAAASTGQEPYTIALEMKENLSENELTRTKFLATDIDLQVLKKAAEGVYSGYEVEGCPERLLKQYFEKTKTPEFLYRVKDEISKMVQFAPLNLVEETYPFQHKFHIIFCRNVLIYFDPQTTAQVIAKMVDCLAPGGFLILGHSETGNVRHPQIKALSQAIYQKAKA